MINSSKTSDSSVSLTGTPLDVKLTALGRRHYQALVATAVKQGEIRGDISLDLAAYAVNTLLQHFSDYAAETGGTSADKEAVYRYQWMEIIKNGICVKD